jgi:hypothetical protein
VDCGEKLRGFRAHNEIDAVIENIAIYLKNCIVFKMIGGINLRQEAVAEYRQEGFALKEIEERRTFAQRLLSDIFAKTTQNADAELREESEGIIRKECGWIHDDAVVRETFLPVLRGEETIDATHHRSLLRSISRWTPLFSPDDQRTILRSMVATSLEEPFHVDPFALYFHAIHRQWKDDPIYRTIVCRILSSFSGVLPAISFLQKEDLPEEIMHACPQGAFVDEAHYVPKTHVNIVRHTDMPTGCCPMMESNHRHARYLYADFAQKHHDQLLPTCGTVVTFRDEPLFFMKNTDVNTSFMCLRSFEVVGAGRFCVGGAYASNRSFIQACQSTALLDLNQYAAASGPAHFMPLRFFQNLPPAEVSGSVEEFLCDIRESLPRLSQQ